MVVPLQPLLDEGPEDDLKAHRELERDRRLARDDPSPVQNVGRENEKDSGPVLEHHHLRIPPPGLRAPGVRGRSLLYNLHFLYNL